MSEKTKAQKLAEMKGLGKGAFGDPVNYQKKSRQEWDDTQTH